MQLRPYQENAINLLRQSLAKGNKRVILQGATAFGKTQVSASIAKSALEKRKRSFFVCDSIDLIDQTVETYRNWGLPFGVMQADHELTDTSQPIQICTAQTLEAKIRKYRKAFEDWGVDLLQIDEAHEQRQIRQVLADLYPEAPFVGWTATPFSKGLGTWWEDLVKPIGMQELIEQGYLSPIEYFAPNQISLDGLKTSDGDFNQDDAAKRMTTKVVADVADTWLGIGEGRPTIGFAPNVATSKKFAEEFQSRGINAVHVDGYGSNDSDKAHRYKTMKDFKSGLIDVLWSCQLTIKGFDAPRVSCIIDCQPTKSLCRHVQKAGRAMRISPETGKIDARVLDHVGNVQLNGLPQDAHIEKLCKGNKGENGDRRPKEQPLPKPCPNTECNYVKEPKQHKCPKCGFAPERKAKVDVIDGDLHKYSKGAEWTTAQKLDWMYQLNHVRIKKGYKKGWAIHKFKSKFGEEPPVLFPKKTTEPTPEVLNWLKHQQIKFAKSKSKAKKQEAQHAAA